MGKEKREVEHRTNKVRLLDPEYVDETMGGGWQEVEGGVKDGVISRGGPELGTGLVIDVVPYFTADLDIVDGGLVGPGGAIEDGFGDVQVCRDEPDFEGAHGIGR
jgi:hypothetical protein